MVPYEFSIKTSAGKQKYLRMKAFLWDVEAEKGVDHWHFDGRLKVFKVAELIKKSLARIAEAEDKENE